VGGGHDGRMVVTQVGDGGAAGEVGPPVSLGIGYPDALGAGGDDIGVEGDDGGDDLIVTADKIAHGDSSDGLG
jgi:hypothetical protein